MNKHKEDQAIVSNALNDTKKWVIDHPFMSEDEVFKHLQRSLKKHAVAMGRNIKK